MILSTRMLLSRRRLVFVVALLCLVVGAFAGLHAGGHHDSADVCGLAWLGCAVVVALALLPCFAGPRRELRTVCGVFAPFDDPSRAGKALPTALGLAALCRLRV